MAARKKKPMSRTATTKRAMRDAKTQANEVIADRKKALRKRKTALAHAPMKKSIALFAGERSQIPAKTIALLGPRSTAGTLLAEGDSWFAYPLHNVLKALEGDPYYFDVESCASNGDRVEDMAYAEGQLSEFSGRLEKLLRAGTVPRAILLSGGGNDMAGRQFEMLLNHAASPINGLNDKIVSGVIDDRIRTSYISIITKITAVCQDLLQRPIPILTHGYDYPVPDGRGFLSGISVLPGPWLQPGFHLKGYTDQDANRATMRILIDRFNVMMKDLVATPSFKHVTFVDLRGTLVAPRYKDDWANELHPNERGFKAVADKFAKKI